MALVRAKHKVYGEVTVPESWLRMWPNEYKPVKGTNKPVKGDADGGVSDEEGGHAADQ